MSTPRVTNTKLPDPLTPAMERARTAYARKWGVALSSGGEPEERAPRPALAECAPTSTQRIAANLRKIADRMEGNAP